MNQRDLVFIHSTMFLFEHYKPNRHFSAALLLFRSLMLSLTAVFFPGSIFMQTAFFVFILSISIVNTLMLQPCKSSPGNNFLIYAISLTVSFSADKSLIQTRLDAFLCTLILWLALANGTYIVVSDSGYDAASSPLVALDNVCSFAIYMSLAISIVAVVIQALQVTSPLCPRVQVTRVQSARMQKEYFLMFLHVLSPFFSFFRRSSPCASCPIPKWKHQSSSGSSANFRRFQVKPTCRLEFAQLAWLQSHKRLSLGRFLLCRSLFLRAVSKQRTRPPTLHTTF